MRTFPKKQLPQRMLVLFLVTVAFAVTALCLVTSLYRRTVEDVQIGAVANKRYVALKDSVDVAATEKKRAEAANSVSPLYKHDEAVLTASSEEIKELFSELNQILVQKAPEESFTQLVKETSLKLPVMLNAEQCDAYEALSPAERTSLMRACLSAIELAYEQGITSDSADKGQALLKKSLAEANLGDALTEMAYTIAASSLRPNLVPDTDATALAKQQKAAEVSDVVIKKGQKIVDEGEIITTDVYERMQTLNLLEDATYKQVITPILGSVMIAVLIFLAIVLFFYGGRRHFALKRNDIWILFTVYLLMIVFLRISRGFADYTLLPLALFAMLVSLLIGMRIGIFLNVFVSILGCLIYNGDVMFLLYFLISGTFGALLMQYSQQRRAMIPVAAVLAAVNFLTIFGLGMFIEKGYTHTLLVSCGYGALSGAVAIILAMGSLPFWENAFETNTPLRLLEFTNPNNKLLRRLMLEAPGTYHHSLIVSNLAETAAYEIGANAVLARVGAYYHDVGKLIHPLYFGENQHGENPHDHLEPLQSAKLIKEHVRYGAKLAEEHKLPKSVAAMTTEHHGTTLVRYFYHKAVQMYGIDNVNEADYRHEGNIPQSREAAILMMADTVEAAVRSMLNRGGQIAEAEELIHRLIKEKLEDGQLAESGLTIKDLDTVREAFMTVFQGMYHDRVAYPSQATAKNKEAAT